jgi:hypothetical protein
MYEKHEKGKKRTRQIAKGEKKENKVREIKREHEIGVSRIFASSFAFFAFSLPTTIGNLFKKIVELSLNTPIIAGKLCEEQNMREKRFCSIAMSPQLFTT